MTTISPRDDEAPPSVEAPLHSIVWETAPQHNRRQRYPESERENRGIAPAATQANLFSMGAHHARGEGTEIACK